MYRAVGCHERGNHASFHRQPRGLAGTVNELLATFVGPHAMKFTRLLTFPIPLVLLLVADFGPAGRSQAGAVPPQTSSIAGSPTAPDDLPDTALESGPTDSALSEGTPAEERWENAIGPAHLVPLEPCEAKRPKVKINLLNLLLSSGTPTDALVLKGELSLGSTVVDIYLPDEHEYRLGNTGSTDMRLNNKATYVSIDQDRDGVLTDTESFPVNRPIRIHSKMYQVTRIEREPPAIELREIDVPLSGIVLGQACPPFRLVSLDGAEITNDTVLGRVTILDVWAST